MLLDELNGCATCASGCQSLPRRATSFGQRRLCCTHLFHQISSARNQHFRAVLRPIARAQPARDDKLELPRAALPQAVDARHPAARPVRTRGRSVRVRHTVRVLLRRQHELDRLDRVAQHILDAHDQRRELGMRCRAAGRGRIKRSGVRRGSLERKLARQQYRELAAGAVGRGGIELALQLGIEVHIRRIGDGDAREVVGEGVLGRRAADVDALDRCGEVRCQQQRRAAPRCGHHAPAWRQLRCTTRSARSVGTMVSSV